MYSNETNYHDLKQNYGTSEIRPGEYPALDHIFKSPLWSKYPSMYLKGGPARTAFLNHVKSKIHIVPDKSMNIRDVDLLVFKSPDCYDSRAFMRRVEWDVAHDPYLKGADIEFRGGTLNPTTITWYLDSRDTEANRAMVRPGMLLYSTDAESYLMNNLESKVAGYSRTWKRDYWSGEEEMSRDFPIHTPRVACRAVLQALKEGLEIPEEELRVANAAGEFNLSLHLIKAFQDHTEDDFVKALFPAFNRHGYMDTYDTEPELVLARLYRRFMRYHRFNVDSIRSVIEDCLKYERQHDLLQRTDLSKFEGCQMSRHSLFVDTIQSLGLDSAMLECIAGIHKACFEQVAFDVNAKPNPESPIPWRHTGQINRLPSLMGKKEVGYGNFDSEWFPDSKIASDDPTVKNLIAASKESQMGYRVGTWGGPGRTVLGKSSALSNENICADTSTSQA